MKICLFGAGGQLGRELTRDVQPPMNIASFDKPQVDIADLTAVQSLIEEQKPQVVINAAAYTAVDKAESERDEAFRVNADGAKYLALAAREVGARYLSVSTDYVFGGPSQQDRTTPFSEDDRTDPVNAYGESKLAGEKEILAEYGDFSLIVRTSSVHGAFGNNFVHTMLRLMEERDELSVVQDQIMSPTWASWLGNILLLLSAHEKVGILNACCRGAISWYEFAVAIRELATFPEGVTPATILPIPTEQYPTPARRPAYSVLDGERLEKLFPGERIDWVAGLRGHLKDLGRLTERPVAELDLKGVNDEE